ncbi:tautomerase family protein [Phenylobacterium terrae]|uniref:Tautomerase family protein n=1 Tax=Phenylobacterium terrae TaxID=2665495 RepID=A0ABW4N6W1_9CAUL
MASTKPTRSQASPTRRRADAARKIYDPESTYSADDKQQIAGRITGIYRALPRFYVGVVFQEVPRTSSFAGGEPVSDFVRIWVDHIARSFDNDDLKSRFLEAVGQLLGPFFRDRGLRWEMHVDETPFSHWTIEGLRPPLPETDAETRWRTENRPTPYLRYRRVEVRG